MEQHPITIQKQVPVDSAARMKKACFDNLIQVSYDLCDLDYNYVNIFSFIEAELSISTSSGNQASKMSSSSNIAGASSLHKLLPIFCLDSTEKAI